MVLVGAGYAGLRAAWGLRRGGLRVTVLEARARVGGRAWSVPLPGGIAELGGEWIFEGYDELRSLAQVFGLELAAMGFDFARRDVTDVDAPLEEQDAIAGALREAAEALPADERRAATLGGFLDGWPPGPAAAALRARLQGTCAVDLAEVALGSAVEEGLLAPGGAGPSWRLSDGNQALALALAESVGDVVLEAGVERVVHDDGEVRVLGDGVDVRAGAAVVAVPLPLLERLEITPLPERVRAAAEALAFGDASKLAIPLERPVAPRARQSVAGPFWWWVSLGARGEQRALATAYAGSPAAQQTLGTASGDPAGWLQRIHALDPDIAPSGEPVLQHWGSDPFALGAYTAIPPGAADAMPALAEAFGRVVLAGEHTAGVRWHGTLEGALRSGARAAEQVLALLGRPT